MVNKNRKNAANIGDIVGLLLVGISVFMALGLVTVAQGRQGTGITNGQSTSASSSIINVICQVFNTIKSAIFILGLTLMILGGALYAGANLMPSQSRGGFQGYGMAMIIGGVIGVAIAVAAPFILNIVISANPNASTVNTTANNGGVGGIGSVGNVKGYNNCVPQTGIG
jgi:hypothetical protein